MHRLYGRYVIYRSAEVLSRAYDIVSAEYSKISAADLDFSNLTINCGARTTQLQIQDHGSNFLTNFGYFDSYFTGESN